MKKVLLKSTLAMALALSLAGCTGENPVNTNITDTTPASETVTKATTVAPITTTEETTTTTAPITTIEETTTTPEITIAVPDDIIETAEESGTCGENLNWYFKDRLLYITGTGEMKDYHHLIGMDDYRGLLYYMKM